MRSKYSDKFSRLDPHKYYARHWLPSHGKSKGILCGIKKEKYDVIKVTEMDFSISAEVHDKALGVNLRLVVVYDSTHDDRRNDFLTELARIYANIKMPTLIGGDFNILRFIGTRIKSSQLIDTLTYSIGL
jgi:hypothetical protein